jgi:hypothetical protein
MRLSKPVLPMAIAVGNPWVSARSPAAAPPRNCFVTPPHLAWGQVSFHQRPPIFVEALSLFLRTAVRKLRKLVTLVMAFMTPSPTASFQAA